MTDLKIFLNKFTNERPLFTALIRAKEAWLWQKYLPFKGPVLDVGAGDGFFAKTAFGKIDAGIDLAGSRMNEAEKYEVYKELKVFDGVNIPYKDKYFSTVIANCVLEHVEHLPRLLSEINRVLKPGGRLIVTVAAKAWEENLLGSKFLGHYYRDFMRKKQQHINLLTPEGWTKVTKKAGFAVKEIIGYLSPAACRRIDFWHYPGIVNLFFYKLTGKWVPMPAMNFWYPLTGLEKIIRPDVKPIQSGALFLCLVKSF